MGSVGLHDSPPWGAPPAGRVVVVHGLFFVPFQFAVVIRALRRAGFETSFVRYASNRQPAAESVREVGAFLDRVRSAASAGEDGSGPVHFVGYSLGALALRSALAARPGFPAGRFVMIAPPQSRGRAAVGATPGDRGSLRRARPRRPSRGLRVHPHPSAPASRLRDHRGQPPGHGAPPFLVAPPANRHRRPPRRHRRAAEHSPPGHPPRDRAPLARHHLLEPGGRGPSPDFPRIRPISRGSCGCAGLSASRRGRPHGGPGTSPPVSARATS